MKRISLEELLYSRRGQPYGEQHRYIMELIGQGRVRPVKASDTNGKSPALHLSYWLLEEKPDYSAWEEELTYRLHPKIGVDYYLAHPEQYGKDRDDVLALDRYLREDAALLDYPESVNERSFEIWNREKFLTKGPGKKILKRCSLDLDFLNIYETGEPLAYYSHTRRVPQDLLILENKDTFYSMRRHMLEGTERILGVEIGTLIYGGGKRILRSFQDFDICVEPYMKEAANKIYYFGDLDYEGIGIYESLAEMFWGRWKIVPFCPAYEKMLEKAARVRELPETKEQQNRNISGTFFAHFREAERREMLEILERGAYIPQEIINISDL